MPILNEKDSKGYYYMFGIKGKKYYYHVGDEKSRLEALDKCKKQQRAIERSKSLRKKKYMF